MTGLRYSIASEVFDRFPGYVRGVVLAADLTNGASLPELVARLRAAEAAVCQAVTLERVAEHPRLKAWREAFRAFGAKPSEHRCSVEAMTRRALRNDPLPTVNTLVDIGNLLSLQHLVPTGGHALDGVTHDLCLRPATGTETFVPLGSDQAESPLPGEIVFVEGDTVLTRRWTWRQGQTTLLHLTTRTVEFNIDGLPPVPVTEVEDIGRELMALIQRYCGGRARLELLTTSHPVLDLSV